jgi:O-antigen/teichoic acid export membrane protein
MSSLSKKTLLLNTSWLSVGLGLGQIINFVSIIVAARYIGPDQYGTYATGLIIVAFTSILARFGLMDALVQREVESSTTSTAFLMSLFLSSASLICTCVISLCFYLSGYSHQAAIIGGLGLSAVFLGIQTVPEAICRRRMDFKQISIIRLLGTIFGSLVLFVGIYAGPSDWVLVAQRVFVEFLVVILLYFRSGMSFSLRWESEFAKDLIRFGRSVGLANFADVIANQFDQILVRVIWGEYALGIYAMARRLVGNVQQLMFMPFRQVSIAAIANTSKNVVEVSRVYRGSTRLILIVSIIAAWSLFHTGELIVETLFADKWIECVDILKVLCWILIYDAYIIMYPAVVHAYSKVNWLLYERLTRMFIGIFLLLILAALDYGMIGAAYAVIAQSLISVPLIMFFIHRLLGSSSYIMCIELLVLFLLSLACYISVMSMDFNVNTIGSTVGQNFLFAVFFGLVGIFFIRVNGLDSLRRYVDR